MDFLKKVVPPTLSGELVLDARDKSQGSSPRLLKVRRLCSTASERTVGHPGGTELCGNDGDRCQHQQIGKVKRHGFQIDLPRLDSRKGDYFFQVRFKY